MRSPGGPRGPVLSPAPPGPRRRGAGQAPGVPRARGGEAALARIRRPPARGRAYT